MSVFVSGGPFALILPAAGQSSRFRASAGETATGSTTAVDHPAATKKPFLMLHGRPVWRWAIEPFLAQPHLTRILIVVSPEDQDWVQTQFQGELAALGSQVAVIAGGQERADSVELGLRQVPTGTELVAVHDAARPLVTADLIGQVIEAARRTGAAIPATPIASTIKRVGADHRITETVPRGGLWAAQTPQIIRCDWLEQAYAVRGDFQPTDEAQLIERLGHPVEVVPGEAWNLKITTWDDYHLAQSILASRSLRLEVRDCGSWLQFFPSSSRQGWRKIAGG